MPRPNSLAEATIYLSLAPKSSSAYLAIEQALADVKNQPTGLVPIHLRDAIAGGKELGHGKGYQYPHDYPATTSNSSICRIP